MVSVVQGRIQRTHDKVIHYNNYVDMYACVFAHSHVQPGLPVGHTVLRYELETVNAHRGSLPFQARI